jgi:hypothetical protein
MNVQQERTVRTQNPSDVTITIHNLDSGNAYDATFGIPVRLTAASA